MRILENGPTKMRKEGKATQIRRNPGGETRHSCLRSLGEKEEQTQSATTRAQHKTPDSGRKKKRRGAGGVEGLEIKLFHKEAGRTKGWQEMVSVENRSLVTKGPNIIKSCPAAHFCAGKRLRKNARCQWLVRGGRIGDYSRRNAKNEGAEEERQSAKRSENFGLQTYPVKNSGRLRGVQKKNC